MEFFDDSQDFSSSSHEPSIKVSRVGQSILNAKYRRQYTHDISSKMDADAL